MRRAAKDRRSNRIDSAIAVLRLLAFSVGRDLAGLAGRSRSTRGTGPQGSPQRSSNGSIVSTACGESLSAVGADRIDSEGSEESEGAGDGDEDVGGAIEGRLI